MVSQCALKLQGSVYVPQSVDTSIMALQLVYDIEIFYPMLISIDASNVCIRPALMANLSLQQAVVYDVLHLGGIRSFKLREEVVASSWDGVRKQRRGKRSSFTRRCTGGAERV